MNKNTITGFILMALLVIGFSWYNQPTPEQIEAQRRYQDSIALVQQQAAVEAAAQNIVNSQMALQGDSAATNAATDSVRALRRIQKYGVMAPLSEGESSLVTLSNENIKVSIDTKGGIPQHVELLKYTNYLKQNVVLFNAEDNQLYFTFLASNGKYLSTADFYFTPLQQTDSSVVMRLAVDEECYLDFVYTLSPESYVLDFSIRYRGLDNVISPTQPSMTVNWNQKLARQEQGRTFEERYSALYYKYVDDDVDELSESSSDDERVSGSLMWVAFKNQFFSSVLISKGIFNAGELTSSVISEEQDINYLKQYNAELEFDINLSSSEIESISMAYYFGPNSYPLLSDIDDEVAHLLHVSDDALQLQKLVPLGWGIFGWVNRFLVIPVFNVLSRFISNYGIIILLLTLFIKLITFPFTYKSYMSSAKMRVVNKLPEVAAINEKYKNPEDAMAKQQAMMAFYQKVGVSPMGGCLPMLLSWPVLLALFYFFPNSIELRGQSFLWAHDLSTYDAIISWDVNIPIISWIFGNHISLFCVLMTATNIIYTKISMSQNAGQQTMPGMKLMMYGMPLMFFAILNNYSAGLSYYYFLSTLLGIIQTYAIRAFVSEDKILQTLKENLKNPKKAPKKKGWVEKLQEIQRRQEQELRQQRERQQRRR